jgi:hypothetical protein
VIRVGTMVVTLVVAMVASTAVHWVGQWAGEKDSKKVVSLAASRGEPLVASMDQTTVD